MPNKNKTGETITGTMSGYGFSIPTSGYDDEDRRVTYNRTDGNLGQSWSLSSVGDWDSITTEGTAQARTHGDSHELTAVAGNSVSSDVKGNMTLIPSAARPTSSSLALEWDMDNRMSSADVDNNSTADVTYQFDALGRRVARTANSATTVYVQSGQQTIADYPSGAASSAPTYRYVYGSYIDEPVLRYQPAGSQSVYYHRNQQYSVTALTNSSGGILERYAYSAYGSPTITNASGTVLTTSAENNRYTYTGREWDDEISLYHYRARMFDPLLGRFCSKDPVGYQGQRSKSLFAYVDNQPFQYVDPSGLVTYRHHWIPTQHFQAFVSKCSFDLLRFNISVNFLRHAVVTPFDPGWGRGTVHDWLHNHFEYNKHFLELVNGSADCCSLLTGLKSLMSEALMSATLHHHTVSPLQPDPTNYLPFPPLSYYHRPYFATDGSLDRALRNVCCRQRRRQVPQPQPFPIPMPAPVPMPPRVPFVPFPAPLPRNAPLPRQVPSVPWWYWPNRCLKRIPCFLPPQYWDGVPQDMA